MAQNASRLQSRQLGKAEHEDFRSDVLELDCGLGIDACAFDGLHHATAKTLVKD